MRFYPSSLNLAVVTRIAAVALACGALSLSVRPALAHSFLVEATPSSKDHVAIPPKIVKLRFGGGVEPPYSKLTIETPDGKVLAEGAVGKPGQAARTLGRRAGTRAGPLYRALPRALHGRAHRRRQLRIHRGRQMIWDAK